MNEAEVKILSLAKAEYKDYNDVRRFAQILSMRPGLIYHTLKEHGFIRQNETTEYRVINAYYEYNGNLKSIAEKTGLGVWICSETLKKFGYSPNWHCYRLESEASRIGGWGENKFKELVPQTLNMNTCYQNNNPVFDFLLGEKTIDVKTSSLMVDPRNKNSRYYRFQFNPENLPDFYCLFAIPLHASELTEKLMKDDYAGDYHILLIPKEILPRNKKTFRVVADRNTPKATSKMYWDFEVQPAALSAFLGEI